MGKKRGGKRRFEAKIFEGGLSRMKRFLIFAVGVVLIAGPKYKEVNLKAFDAGREIGGME